MFKYILASVVGVVISLSLGYCLIASNSPMIRLSIGSVFAAGAIYLLYPRS